jgi:hypothetical protein
VFRIGGERLSRFFERALESYGVAGESGEEIGADSVIEAVVGCGCNRDGEQDRAGSRCHGHDHTDIRTPAPVKTAEQPEHADRTPDLPDESRQLSIMKECCPD